MPNTKLTIDPAALTSVTGGIINTILDHKPGTDWNKVGQAAWKGAGDIGPAAAVAGAIPGPYAKAAGLVTTGLGAYYGAANEYLAQQKKLK